MDEDPLFHDESFLWGLIQLECISNKFYVLVKEMGSAIDILPLNLLKITADIERKWNYCITTQRGLSCSLMHESLKKIKASGSNDRHYNRQSARILSSIGLRIPSDYDGEILKSERLRLKAGKEGLIVVSNINNLISLVSYTNTMIFRNRDDERDSDKEECKQLYICICM